jgi:hypothetical protein
MSYRYSGQITFFENEDGRRVPMRSRLEARWATFFTAAALDWEYEPRTFSLRNNQIYTPDFYLPEVGWIEIKATPEDAQAAESKLCLFAQERNNLIEASHRKEFYTICAPKPDFDIHGFHRWDPEPAEIYWAEDIYLLFCGVETLKTAERLKIHPIGVAQSLSCKSTAASRSIATVRGVCLCVPASPNSALHFTLLARLRKQTVSCR